MWTRINFHPVDTGLLSPLIQAAPDGRTHTRRIAARPGIQVASGAPCDVELSCEHAARLARIFTSMAALCRGLDSADDRLRAADILGGSRQVMAGSLLDSGHVLVRVGNPFARNFPAVSAPA